MHRQAPAMLFSLVHLYYLAKSKGLTTTTSGADRCVIVLPLRQHYDVLRDV